MTVEERLAKLETAVDHIGGRLESIAEDTRETRDAVHKYRSFAAGASAAFAVLWSAVVGLAMYAWQAVTGGVQQ